MNRSARWIWATPVFLLIGCEGAKTRAVPDDTVALTMPSAAAAKPGSDINRSTMRNSAMGDRVVKTDAEWRKLLTPEQYDITRRKGTERAFTGKYWNHHAEGMYRCVACGEPLFTSDTKFDSGTGWPSFWGPVSKDSVEVEGDDSHGMQRDEVVCRRCQSHLGHVFDDGPRPTGMRYCINSAALRFEEKGK